MLGRRNNRVKVSLTSFKVWESTAHLRAAFTDPEFLAKISRYPTSVVAIPHLFQKVAVPGICVA